MDEIEKIKTQNFTPRQIDILKNSICTGVTDDEFQIFLMACVKTKLDPFMKQIYAVKRWARGGEVMTIQTGIDGYRLIAERTGCYAPGTEPTYVHDETGRLISATAYIKKMTKDGTWHLVSASAYFDEYCPKTKNGSPMAMWATMPKVMISKCAEALALRKAFPAEMSGIYTKEEMDQCLLEESAQPEKISKEEAQELENSIGGFKELHRQVLKIGEAQEIQNILKSKLKIIHTMVDKYKQNFAIKVDSAERQNLSMALEDHPDIAKDLFAYFGVGTIDDLPKNKYASIMKGIEEKIQLKEQDDERDS